MLVQTLELKDRIFLVLKKGLIMKNIIMRWALSAASIAAASFFIPGIRIEGSNAIITVFLFAIILGLVNALLRPLTTIASIGLVIVTFGLFLLVINALMLWSASYVAVNWFNIGFYVDGFWPAFWGAILISIFSVIFQQVLKEDNK